MLFNTVIHLLYDDCTLYTVIIIKIIVVFVAGKRWVGWSNDSTGNQLELVFEFNGIRTFKEVKIHTSHIPTRDVKVNIS